MIIDCQPVQVGSIASMDRRTLVTNTVAVARTARLFCLPIVLSTVNVNTGANQPTVHEVYAFVDAVGGTSVEAHRAVLERLMPAGAKPTSWVQVLCELQRDWSRKETASQFADIQFAVEGR